MMPERVLAAETPAQSGREITLKGWVANRRDHGKLIFLDLRDRSGLVQVVILPASPAHAIAVSLRNEFVVEVQGTVSQRPTAMVNPELASGSVEVAAASIRIVSEAKTPPFELDDTSRVDEELRMKYRYLDLRSSRMARNLRLRHRVTTMVRDYLNKQDFIEVETPLLTKTSPEGARDFLVPSRLQPGKFYALPQSPQQYKQLLMLAGVERYYQIAKCLRDEDLRSDRQLEHTQIDMEMSFVSPRDIFDIVEGMYTEIVESLGKKVWKKPFPVFTHAEALHRYGADKFDMRPEDDRDPDTLAFAWVVDFPLFERDEETGAYTFAHNPFSAPKPEDVDKLLAGQDLGQLRADQYDLVCNGLEIASGGVRISNPKVQRKVFEIMGLTPQQTEERFGHLIAAYEYGAPPHAGIAPGLDRFISLLAGEKDIREVIAFPVNSSGRTSVMAAPTPVGDALLDELGIMIRPNKDLNR